MDDADGGRGVIAERVDGRGSVTSHAVPLTHEPEIQRRAAEDGVDAGRLRPRQALADRRRRKLARHGVADALSGAGDDDAEAEPGRGPARPARAEEVVARSPRKVLRGARREGGEEDDVRRETSRRDDEYECDAKRGGAEKRVAANEDMVDRAKTDAGASAASARGAEGAILPVYPALVAGRTTRENISRPMIGRVPIESEPRRSASRIDRGRSGRSDRSSFQARD